MGDAELILGAISGLHEKIDGNSKETHKRIDGLVDSVGKVQVSVGEMTVSLDTVKEDVNGHLQDHKQSGREVIKSVMASVLTVGGMLLVAWVVYEMGWK